ncbi:Tymo-45kd-70kd multi-domain protein [Pyrenophora tritici-repentis]|uniref:Tymo-45kd-70kd multi-domain protein n=1 Tax=Pyrenophora tritici-repentis TaxID=45151 RepID=A0A317A7W6_9PLEO|nr:Tymo-45kd-70kd multi-domain protein [Pyrenophora tritici-repentis]
MSMISQTLQGAVLSITSNVLAQAITSYQDSTPFALNYNQVLQFALFSILSNPPQHNLARLPRRPIPHKRGLRRLRIRKTNVLQTPPPKRASAKQTSSSNSSSTKPSALL